MVFTAAMRRRMLLCQLRCRNDLSLALSYEERELEEPLPNPLLLLRGNWNQITFVVKVLLRFPCREGGLSQR